MLEIEIKSACDDPVKIESLLQELGAEFKATLLQRDTYFMHPCRDFKVTDEALRLRNENGEHTLHYKGPKIDAETKTREEIGLPISEPQLLLNILDRLGFKEAAVVEKHRKTYVLADIEIAIDEVTNLGSFVELEIQDADLEDAKSRLFELMEKLGLRKTIRSSYLELLEKGIRSN